MQEVFTTGARCRLRMEKGRDLCMGIRMFRGVCENSYCVLIKFSGGFCCFWYGLNYMI